MGKLPLLEHEEDTGDILDRKYSQKKMLRKEKSATAESAVPPKKKIWIDKSHSSSKSTLATKLLKILVRDSTQKEKGLMPFWTQASKDISEKLWLPTEIDSVESTLISSKGSSRGTPKGGSWFSIKKRLPLKKNSSQTSFPLSQYSLGGSMVSGATPLKGKSGLSLLKTLKLRIFPNQCQRETFRLMFKQYRWYYNATLNIAHDNHCKDNKWDKRKYSKHFFRDLVRKHEYVEEIAGNFIFKEFVRDEERNSIPIPYWWEDTGVHSRIPRGAAIKFTSSLNSAISNLANGNCKKFEMKHMTKKSPTEYLHFEDNSFPFFIKEIESRYWFTNSKGKRTNIPYSEIGSKKGLEVIHEKETGKYFLHVPVARDWFPEEDRRINNQDALLSKGNKGDERERVIALDPGVRKFLTGYDPEGKSHIFGKGAHRHLTTLLQKIDRLRSEGKSTFLSWKKIKNMISEMHWKVASFLIANYDTIMYPDFRTSQMVRKGKPLSRSTRRLMNMFSFYKFKEKLLYKCQTYGKKLLIVDESYTSCTCGVCGKITRNAEEIYECNYCGLVIDRDAIASRNILIKNLTLR